MNNIMLDDFGYPVGQRWCCTETAEGNIAVLVAKSGNLNTTILEGIALSCSLPPEALLAQWSREFRFTLNLTIVPD